MTEKEIDLIILRLYPKLSPKDIKEFRRIIKENPDTVFRALKGESVRLGPLGLNDLRIVHQILLNPLNLKRVVSSEVLASIMGNTPQNQPDSPYAIRNPAKTPKLTPY